MTSTTTICVAASSEYVAGKGLTLCPVQDEADAAPQSADRVALRRRWVEMMRRLYEVDPLVCPRCGGEMRVVGVITQPAVIRRILDHLRKREKVARSPPHAP
jgi:hypothetical protein